jgi:hypothetical protein
MGLHGKDPKRRNQMNPLLFEKQSIVVLWSWQLFFTQFLKQLSLLGYTTLKETLDHWVERIEKWAGRDSNSRLQCFCLFRYVRFETRYFASPSKVQCTLLTPESP